jgi:hypothetical protein
MGRRFEREVPSPPCGRPRACRWSGLLKLTHDPGILPLSRGSHADRHAPADGDGVRLLELPEAGRSMGLYIRPSRSSSSRRKAPPRSTHGTDGISSFTPVRPAAVRPTGPPWTSRATAWESTPGSWIPMFSRRPGFREAPGHEGALGHYPPASLNQSSSPLPPIGIPGGRAGPPFCCSANSFSLS